MWQTLISAIKQMAFIKSLQQTNKTGEIILFILQMIELKHREVKCLAQGYTVNE